MESILWTDNHMPKGGGEKELALITTDKVEQARRFHQSFPQYSETPLVSLNELAARGGVAGVHIKDESFRFGLNAFKALGGSWAMANFISERTGRPLDQLTYQYLTSPEVKKELGDFTFYAATDGNHGRGVAWAAAAMGQKSVIYMPKGSSEARFNAIKNEGADVTITDMNYDDAVRKAYADSQKDPNSVIIQDTAWDGYETIPGWVMQGYGTLALEAMDQLRTAGVNRPTHVIVQAGVGCFAGAVQGFFANLFPDNCPTTTIVEAQIADCIYRSAAEGSGKVQNVDGDLFTIMAGLACGEANTQTWEILRNKTSFFASLPDWVAADGMRVLAAPLRPDKQVVSGESGAAGMGLLVQLLFNPAYAELKKTMGIGPDSQILLFSTEGDTDPDSYHNIVWGGAYPNPGSLTLPTGK